MIGLTSGLSLTIRRIMRRGCFLSHGVSVFLSVARGLGFVYGLGGVVVYSTEIGCVVKEVEGGLIPIPYFMPGLRV